MNADSQLLELFQDYNPDVWPLPVLAYAIGLGALALIAFRPSSRTDRLVSGFLALLWLSLGIIFQGIYVREVNPALGMAYATIFVLAAALIARSGIVRRALVFRPGRNAGTVLAAIAILYGLVIYPALGIFLGHSYPEAALFGAAPCPTTLVTLGLFLLVQPPFPKRLLMIPLVWGGPGASCGGPPGHDRRQRAVSHWACDGGPGLCTRPVAHPLGRPAEAIA